MGYYDSFGKDPSKSTPLLATILGAVIVYSAVIV